jgi:glutamine---fructose-6-phosphate transaminase (isomerizing)
MCGIVGYLGPRDATPILLAGLKRLEYRGYDSAGLALLESLPSGVSTNGSTSSLVEGRNLVITKCKGKVSSLEELTQKLPVHSNLGIGHTRWATHGAPSDVNSHPHMDQNERIAIIHNGIIENYNVIKSRLLSRGHEFKSQTDTEVLAHLIGEFYTGDTTLTEAVRLALNEVVGAYGIAVISKDSPNEIVCARKGSRSVNP